MGATDEPEEEIIEGKVLEAEGEEDDLNLDLDNDTDTAGDVSDVPATDAEPSETPAETTNSEVPAETAETPASTETSDISTETPEETPVTSEEPNLTEPQKYLVVYSISGDDREEIFRCGSNNAVNAFNAFYNDTFKGSMKDAILNYKQKKETEKAEAEKAEKTKAQSEKESKVKKFLGESKKSEKELEYLIIHGRVGNKDVIAYVYPGNDRDLSYYKIEGEKGYKMGHVKFSEIYSQKSKKY
jgi:hypothetical protein